MRLILSLIVVLGLGGLGGSASAQDFDLLLKGGHVIDSRNRLSAVRDVAIKDGKIKAIASDIPAARALKTVDVSGLYVTPGLIDIHGHVYRPTYGQGFRADNNAVYPDGFSFRAGVTTFVDPGGAGWRNFEDMKDKVIDRSLTRVLAFINIVGLGMAGGKYEQDLGDMEVKKTAEMALKHKGLIVGVKSAHYAGPEWDPFIRAVEVGKIADIPVMVDFGSSRPERPLYDLLNRIFRPGDIFTHVYGGNRGEQDGTTLGPSQALIDGRTRGVLFDVGHGAGSFRWRVAVPLIKAGFLPDTISTDLHTHSMNSTVKDVLNLMSKFLAMGMPLDRVVAANTWNAAKAIKQEQLGHLSVDAVADVAVLRLEKGTFGFTDQHGARLKGDQMLRCELTLRDGKVVYDLNNRTGEDWDKRDYRGQGDPRWDAYAEPRTSSRPPLAAAAQPPGSPLLKELNAIAQQQLKDRADAVAAVRDVAAAEARKTDVRRRILSHIGGLPEYRGPLKARVTKTIEREGFVIEHVLFESLPNYYVTANLYRPDRTGRHPAVLMSMGHWESGKAAAQLLSANLARKGFVVLAYDPVGQGERQQAYDARFGRSLIGGATEQHFTNGAAAILMGHSVARYFIHDGMRAIDYLVSRPDVDPERIGATGCSGGGTQTTYIAALDARVKVAAVACYMNSFQTLFAGSIGDSEQSVPGFLAAGLDQTDYVELFAPKPWLITSTEGDFFTLPGARQVFEEAQRWYKLYGAEERIHWVVGPGGHGTPLEVREAIYGWMIRWLEHGAGDAREEAVTLIPDHELRVTTRGQVEGRELYQVISDTPRQKGSTTELETFVRDLMARNQPLVRSFRILPAVPGASRRPAIVLVQDTLTPGADAEKLLAEGNVVMLVALSGRSEDTRRPRSGNWMNNTRAWLVGRNLPAMHAAEINAAVTEAAGRPDVDPARITARASGVAGVALLLASVVNSRIGSLSLDRTPYSVRAAIDVPIHTNLHDAVIPGFAVKWDLADLRDLIRPRTLVWKDPTDWMGNVVALDGRYTYTASDPNVPR